MYSIYAGNCFVIGHRPNCPSIVSVLEVYVQCFLGAFFTANLVLLLYDYGSYALLVCGIVVRHDTAYNSLRKFDNYTYAIGKKICLLSDNTR